MKRLQMFFMMLVFTATAKSQDSRITTLQAELQRHQQLDTTRVNLLNQLADNYALPLSQKDSISQQALSLAKQLNYAYGQAYALINKAAVHLLQGRKNDSYALLQNASTIAKDLDDKELQVKVLLAMGQAKSQTADNKQALRFYLQAEQLASALNDKPLMAKCQRQLSMLYRTSFSNYTEAMEWVLKSIHNSEAADCLDCLAQSWVSIAALYGSMGDHVQSLHYYQKALTANKQLGNTSIQTNLYTNIGERYRLLGQYTKAIDAYKHALTTAVALYDIEVNESNIADAYTRLGNLPMAFQYASRSLNKAKQLEDVEGQAWINGILGRAYLEQNNADSAIYHATVGLSAAYKTGTIEFIRDNSQVLAKGYAAKKDFDKAYQYQTLFYTYRDSMVNQEVTNKSYLMQYNFDLQKKQTQITALNQEKKSQRYLLLAAAIVLVLIVFIVFVLWRNNNHKQRAYNLLSKQKQLLQEERDKTNLALSDLQLAQNQLVQAEKMASLGELTAGIAHEIQNPLNFVNNFSELNAELIDEMLQELENGNILEATSIAADIKENDNKIKEHGHRAENIVKSMLLHSRASAGNKEQVNINELAEEYLRLSYHGLKAKDKSFNATMKVSLDESIPAVSLVKQEIGRVLLNLFNNAFYSVKEKKKILNGTYEPQLALATIKKDNLVEICVSDNGLGIPAKILDKIMQPFYTTKPAGEGTGLGLSLSYDVIKAHGGTLQVETTEGEMAKFIIQLPVSS